MTLEVAGAGAGAGAGMRVLSNPGVIAVLCDCTDNIVRTHKPLSESTIMVEAAALRSPSSKAVADWTASVNRLLSASAMGTGKTPVSLITYDRPKQARRPATISFSGSVAEAVVKAGLHASAVPDLAEVSGVEPRHLLDFLGIDRTTVKRRADRGESLPLEASVKAMEFTELTAAAVDVFGDLEPAIRWLTRPHPLLGDETPLQRARTPWGNRRVLGMLNALRYGGVA